MTEFLQSLTLTQGGRPVAMIGQLDNRGRSSVMRLCLVLFAPPGRNFSIQRWKKSLNVKKRKFGVTHTLMQKKISSLGDLRESESLDGTLSDRPVNVMDGIGRAHNEVLFNMSKRAEEYQGRSKEYVLSHLRSETDAVLQRADNYDYSHSLRSLGQEASKEDGSRHGEEERKTDPYSKALEDEILRDYSHSIASEESLQGTKSYYDEVSKLVQESNVSEETRVRMLVFISVATHSKALWSKVVEQEVASDH